MCVCQGGVVVAAVVMSTSVLLRAGQKWTETLSSIGGDTLFLSNVRGCNLFIFREAAALPQLFTDLLLNN